MRISDGSSDGCSSDLFVACASASVGEVFAKIALGGVAQRLAVVLMQVTGHPFVDALVHQQHFDAALVQRFDLWTVAGGIPAVGGAVVDRLLLGLHARDVGLERHPLISELGRASGRESVCQYG